MKMIGLLLNRSLWLYVAVAVLFAVVVDYKKAAKHRAHYLLGIFYNQELRNFKDGIVYFDYLTHQRPDDSRNYFFLGYCYLHSMDYHRAVRYFEQALRWTPDNVLVQQYLAHAKSKMNNDGSNVPLPGGVIAIPLE